MITLHKICGKRALPAATLDATLAYTARWVSIKDPLPDPNHRPIPCSAAWRLFFASP